MAKRSTSFRLKAQLMYGQLWIQTLIVSVSSTLPWLVRYVLPALRYILCKLGTPQFWQYYLTQPVLFFLINVIILSIWLTSKLSAVAFSDSDITDAMREENQRWMWGAGTDRSSSQRIVSSTRLHQLISTSPAPKVINSPSILPFDQSIGIKTAVAVCAGDSEIAASMKKRVAATYSQGKLRVDGQAMADGSSGDGRIEASVDTETTLRAATSLKAVAGEALKLKLPTRSLTLPRAVVRGPVVESGLSRKEKMQLAMDRDDLKERIEAFLAKFHEQMRQEMS